MSEDLSAEDKFHLRSVQEIGWHETKSGTKGMLHSMSRQQPTDNR
jgi:hypothetical protein